MITELRFVIDGLDDATVGQIRQTVDKIIADAKTVTRDWPAGWTPAAAGELLSRLHAEGRHAQLAALTAAVENDGAISRERVYDLAGYAPERSLRGFARPISRIVRSLVDEGMLPAAAPLPLEAAYDPENRSFQQTIGYRIPAPILPAFRDAVDELGNLR